MSTYTPAPGSLIAEVCALLRREPELHELSVAEIVRRFPGKAKTSNINPCLASGLAHHILDRTRNSRGDLVYRRGRHFNTLPAVATAAPTAAAASAPTPGPTAGLAHMVEQLGGAPSPAAAPAGANMQAPGGYPGCDVCTCPPGYCDQHARLQAALNPPPAPAPTAKASAPKGPPRGQRPKRLPPIDRAKLIVRTDVPLPSPASATRGRTRYDDDFALLKAVGHSLPYPKAYAGSLMQAARTYCKRHPDVHLLVRADPNDPNQCGVWRVSAEQALKATQAAKRTS